MKIIIEVSPQIEGKRGIGVYTENLIKHLAKIDKKNEYIIFSWFFRDYEKKLKMLYCPKQKNFSMFVKRFPNSFLTLLEWKFHVPIIKKFIQNENIHIYHSLGPRLPRVKGVKTIITVHDLIPEIFPQWCNTEFIKENRRAIKSADAIITDSQNTKNDLIKIHNVDKGKIKIVHLGVDTKVYHPVKSVSLIENVRQKYNLPDKFILAVGPFEPRRNLKKIFEAYKKIKNKFSSLKIVLVGRINGYVQNLLARSDFSQDLIITGYIPKADLCAIYNLAQVFVHPSFYEGFGLQVLEAMACECPVITSATSSLGEIAKESAILVNPHSANEIAQGIENICANQTLKKNLIARGVERIKQFSWQTTAEKTLEIYIKLAETGHVSDNIS